MPETCVTPPDKSSQADSRPQAGRIASGFRIVSVLTLLSRILGMLRDMAMAYAFGAGPLMDAFAVAFKIPNLARRLFGEGALTTAFLPVFVREQESKGNDDARRVATAVTFVLGGTLFGLVVAGELLLGLLWLVAPAGSDSQTLIVLTAEMLPYLLLICLAAQLSAVLQSIERFFWPALLPTILNAVWIATVLIAVRTIESPWVQIQGVALSVFAAGVLQCGAAWWSTHAAGYHFVKEWRTALPQVREIVDAMLPIVLGLSITQINTIGDSLLAWGLARPSGAASSSVPMIAGIDWPLEAGTASALFYAQRMYQFPVGVFGIALGTVLFPLLSRHAERGELDQVGRDQSLGLRLTVAIGLPASVGLMLLSERIAVLFFQRGAFTAGDATLTAECIVAYGSGVWAFLALIIINRGFYALGDRTTPIRYALYAVGINLVLNFLLIWPLAGSGLAWATALAAMAQVAMTVAAYRRMIGRLSFAEIARASGRTVIATTSMALACWAAMAALPMSTSTGSRAAAVIGPLLAAVAAYLLTSKLVRLREPFVLLSGRSDL